MTNNADRRRLSPDARRAQIVDVAAAHFTKHGVAGASMTRIAEDAGVTRALVYHYFSGKEALLDAVFEREAESVLVATTPLASLSERENLERALTGYLDRFEASSGDLRELYAPSAAPRSPAAELIAQNHTVQVNRLLDISGADDTPASRLAMSAWLAFVEHVARGAAQSPVVPRERVLALCLAAFEGILGRRLSAG
ncbi:TetR/AcrR family transcriptional regulator [Microbacterium sp. KR10-403]|uniref:TetR/AcrR family transcriptional regulator n=1 Tax=Microbacterium sp. KR10-403 TaxID=3158581 RepID=UPI0032E41516